MQNIVEALDLRMTGLRLGDVFYHFVTVFCLEIHFRV